MSAGPNDPAPNAAARGGAWKRVGAGAGAAITPADGADDADEDNLDVLVLTSTTAATNGSAGKRKRQRVAQEA